ncbi:ferric reductase transmembrane [Colletotrichum sojae]|uniref:ferric-chelate reductase (NADPH) n=1 Tax=Colletotrichum sojae TaxID=2175907 RepID=A0A8H6N1M5_9PEZI|nr:ferric reductase transmembrane [Colletotrichum sojae]
MSLPWLDQPVMLHSSRDPGMCSMTPEQCAYKTRYWVFWYEADHRYGLPTTAFFLAAIILAALCHFSAVYTPASLRRNPLWLRLVSLGRFVSYTSWRLGGWNSQSLAAYVLGAVGAIFFLAMTLGPQPYYWPNTREVSFGNSPPIATRAGYMALACMPFLFVLGAKANPISILTGISHEKLNIWHNWVAWAMFVLALVHTFPFVVFNQWKGDLIKSWNDGGTWVTGVIALLAQAWLTFMSIRRIRDRYYEFFKATHFFAAAVFFVFFFIHCDFRLTSWDYFIATAVLYALCWFYSLSKTYMEHGVKKATLSLVTPTSMMVVIETDGRWSPGQHVYLRFFTCGLHALTTHPFTISSVPQRGRRNEMVFYVQPRRGLTGRLAKLAEKQPGATVSVLTDGPYGGVTGRWFQGFDRVLVVAGGAGAGYSLSMIEHVLQSAATGSSNTELQVVVASRDRGFREWYCQALEHIVERQDKTEEAKRTSISVHIHDTSVSEKDLAESPVNENGKEVSKQPAAVTNKSETNSADFISTRNMSARPNLQSIARGVVSGPGTVGMVVCGPSSMVFELKQCAAMAQKDIVMGKGSAKEVWFYDESFT